MHPSELQALLLLFCFFHLPAVSIYIGIYHYIGMHPLMNSGFLYYNRKQVPSLSICSVHSSGDFVLSLLTTFFRKKKEEERRRKRREEEIQGIGGVRHKDRPQ